MLRFKTIPTLGCPGLTQSHVTIEAFASGALRYMRAPRTRFRSHEQGQWTTKDICGGDTTKVLWLHPDCGDCHSPTTFIREAIAQSAHVVANGGPF